MKTAAVDPGDWVDEPPPEQQGPPSPPAFMLPGTVANTALGRLKNQLAGGDIPKEPASDVDPFGGGGIFGSYGAFNLDALRKKYPLPGDAPSSPPAPPSDAELAVRRYGESFGASAIPDSPQATEGLRAAQAQGGVVGHVAAATEGLTNIARGLATPINALLAAGATMAPAEWAPLVSTYFATDMGKATLAQVPELADAWSRGDTVALTRLLAEAVPTAAMGGMAAKHAVRGVRNAGMMADFRDAQPKPGEQGELIPGVNAPDPMAPVRRYAEDQVAMGQGLDEAAAVKANAALPRERTIREATRPVTLPEPTPEVLGPDGRPAVAGETQMPADEFRQGLQEADVQAKAAADVSRKLDTLNQQLTELDRKISERFGAGQGTPDLPKSYPMPPASPEDVASEPRPEPVNVEPPHAVESAAPLAAEPEAPAAADNPYDLPPDIAEAVARAKENMAKRRAEAGPNLGLAIRHVDNLGNEHSLLTTKDHVEQLGASILWRGIEDPRKWQNAMRREFGQNVFIASDAKGRKLLSPEKVYEGARAKLAEHGEYAEGGEGLGLTTPKKWNDLLQRGLRSKDWYDTNQDKLVVALGSIDRAVQQYRHQAAASPRLAVEISISKTLDLIRAEVTGTEPPKGLLHKKGVAAAARGERPSGGKVGPYFDSLSEQLTKIPALETVVDTIISRAMGFGEHVSDGRRQFIDAVNRMSARKNKLSLKQAQASTWTGFQDEKGETRAGMETKGDPYADQFLRQLDERGGGEKLYDATPFEDVAAATRKGGATWKVGADAAPVTRGYAYGGYPDRTQKIEGHSTADQIREFVDKNRDLLRDLDVNHLGTWFNKEDGHTYHDVSKVSPDRDFAMSEARKNGEKAIYSLHEGIEIPTSEPAIAAGAEDFDFGENEARPKPKLGDLMKASSDRAKTNSESWIASGGTVMDIPAPIRLDHYSHERREVLDPEFMGTNRAGAERGRPDRRKRTYYYPEGAKPEHGLGKEKHTVEVDPRTLYNLNTDPKGIVARERAKGASLDEIENAVADAGYTGYGANRSGGPEPEAYALFESQHPLPVEPTDFIDMVEGVHEAGRGQPNVGLGINVRSANALKRQRQGQKFANAQGAPEERLDKMAAFLGKYGKSGLRELEVADPELVRKFRKAVVAGGGAHEMTANFIRSLLKDGLKFDDFSTPAMESRLRGVQEVWQRNADEVLAGSGDDALAKYGQGKGPHGYESLVRPLADTKMFAKDGLLQKVEAAFERGDGDTLKDVLGDAFKRAADGVAHIQTDAEYKKSTSDPRFQKALKRYKDTIEPVLIESHMSNLGWMSKDLGPLDTYFPLSTPEVTPIGKLIRRRGAFAKPSNPWNQKATGLADAYDARSEAFAGHLREGLQSNSLADALRSAEEAGITRKFTADVMPEAFTWKGRDFVPGVHGNKIMPKWFKDEVMPILSKDTAAWSNEKAQAVRNMANFLALVGPFDLVYHSTNLMGTGATRIPPQYRGSWVSKLIGSVPGIGGMPAMIYDTMTKNTLSPANVKKITRLRELGLMPDLHGTQTYSKKLANEMGIKHTQFPFSFTPMLHGPMGLDVRARLVFLDTAEKMKMTPEETYHFVNNLGNYTYQLNASMARAIKKAGLSTFYTAGAGMNWNGVVALLGTQKMPESMGAGKRAATRMTQAITSGTIGALLVWTMQYKAELGMYPWEDKDRMKVFRIPYGKDEKTGAIKYKSILDFLNPLLSRGARVLGANGAAETLVRGGSVGQAIDSAKRDVLNSQLHPLAGPGARVLTRGVFGIDPYVVGTNDPRGRPVTQFMPAVPKAAPGIPSRLAEAKAGLEGLNPLIEPAWDRTEELITGKPHKPKPFEKTPEEAAAGVYAPRYYSKANPIKERVRLARERVRAARP